MATADELRCMATLCANLNDAAQELSGHQGTSSLEQEALELLDLVPQILDAGPHPGRIAALLYQVEPAPLAVVCRLTHTQLAVSSRLRAVAAKTLTRVLGSCLSPECADYLAPRVRDSLRELYLVPVLINTIAKGNPKTDAAAAAELLFLLTMQLPSLRDDLILEHGGIATLLTRLVESEEPGLRSFVAATIRVVAQVSSETFTSNHLQFFSALASVLHDPNEVQTSVLLLETLTDIVARNPSAYIAQVLTNEALLEELTDSVTALLSVEGARATADLPEASAVELQNAAIACVRAIMAIEGASESQSLTQGNRGMRSTFAHVTAWQKAISTAAALGHSTTLLELQRWLVATAVTRHHVLALQRPFIESFPSLCVLLNAEKSTPECMIEAALLLGLCSAKVIGVRRDVGALVAGYEAWASHLHTTIAACIRRAKSDGLLAGVFVIDEHQYLLNDGALLARVETIDFAGVVRALFSEQERRGRAAQMALAAGSAGGAAVALGPVRVDLYDPSAAPIPARSLEAAEDMCAGILERAAALALTPADVRASDSALRGDPSVIASQLSQVAKRQLQGGSVMPPTASPSAAPSPARSTTPRRRAAYLNASLNSSQHFADPAAALNTSTRSRTPTGTTALTPAQQKSERIAKVARMFGGTPNKRTPFRPASPSASARAAVLNPSLAVHNSSSSNAALVLHGNQQQQLLVEALQVRGDRGDEYMSMSIMMHLPIAFGVHYNREGRGAVRRVAGPNGNMYMQPVHRNTSHSWTIMDVREGDVYVLFVPFHKLTVERIEAEVLAVERYLLSTKKQLVLTPQQQRSRRWFLHDMLNYVLPKTELLLRDMLQLLRQFSADNVVYQMGVIRLLEEGRREKQDVLQTALEDSDSAMPTELLRFSSGRLKDILHSGNLSFAVRKLKEHFFGGGGGSDGGAAGDGGLGSPIHGDDVGVPAQLASIDREIERLERQAMDDTWGKEAAADAHDDVEPAYSHQLVGREMKYRTENAAASMLDPTRYAAAHDDGVGLEAEHDEDTGALHSNAPPQQAPTPQQQRDAVAVWSRSIAKEEPLPYHLQAAFERGRGTADGDDDSSVRSSRTHHTTLQGAAPTLNDFDAMYAAVEQSYAGGA